MSRRRILRTLRKHRHEEDKRIIARLALSTGHERVIISGSDRCQTRQSQRRMGFGHDVPIGGEDPHLIDGLVRRFLAQLHAVALDRVGGTRVSRWFVGFPRGVNGLSDDDRQDQRADLLVVYVPVLRRDTRLLL